MIISIWPQKKISEFAKVVGGGTPSRKNNSFFGGEIPWITPKDLSGYESRYIERGYTNLTKSGLKKSSAIILPKNSIIFSSRAPIGYIAIAKNELCTNQGFKSLICKPEIAYPEFIFYLIKYYTPNIESFASGTTFKEISGNNLSNIKLPLPPILIQKKISQILNQYDSLFENNMKRIRILQEIGYELYKKWFLNYSFPNNEDLQIINSKLGKIPNGWKIKKIKEVCLKINAGGTPLRKNNEYWNNGTIDWYKTRELWDKFVFNAEEKITELGLKKSSAKIFSRGSILMAIYGSPTVGRLAILTKNACSNQAAIGINSNSDVISQQFLFYTLYNLRTYFNNIAQGAAQQNISKEKVLETQFILPPKELIDKFTIKIKSIWELLENLQMQNIILNNIRKIFLENLILGNIDVSKLDIKIDNKAT